MNDDVVDQHWAFRGALPTSLALHLLILALLIFGLPTSLSEPDDVEAIKVDLVPPPESEEAEAPPPAEQPEQDEAKPEEPKAEEIKPEEPKPEEPMPEEPQPEEPKPEPPPPPSEEAAQPPPPRAMQPVVQFGEEDTGPRKSEDGTTAEAGSEEPVTEPTPEPEEAVVEAPPVVTVEGPGDAAPPIPPEKPVDEKPAPEPTEAATPDEPLQLDKATTLFSRAVTDDPVAITAMRQVPRDQRAGRLCVTELRQQLLNGLPPYYPDLLPTHPLEKGTIIEIPVTAFRSARRWYNLSYRCEVDAEAMKVVSFAYRVGLPVPRDDWKRRGLPSQ